jgi:hypothetical protein
MALSVSLANLSARLAKSFVAAVSESVLVRCCGVPSDFAIGRVTGPRLDLLVRTTGFCEPSGSSFAQAVSRTVRQASLVAPLPEFAMLIVTAGGGPPIRPIGWTKPGSRIRRTLSAIGCAPCSRNQRLGRLALRNSPTRQAGSRPSPYERIAAPHGTKCPPRSTGGGVWRCLCSVSPQPRRPATRVLDWRK